MRWAERKEEGESEEGRQVERGEEWVDTVVCHISVYHSLLVPDLGRLGSNFSTRERASSFFSAGCSSSFFS